MTTLAFKATYSDWKLIKTRGVVQVVMEVPLSEADAAYQILGGMPDFSQERWFGVAPLKVSPAAKEKIATPQPAPDKPLAGAKRDSEQHTIGSGLSKLRVDWRELQPAAQAGIRSGDPVFRKFLLEMHGWHSLDEDEAARGIRAFCGVKSRAELGSNHKARVLWKQLDDHFTAWKHVDA